MCRIAGNYLERNLVVLALSLLILSSIAFYSLAATRSHEKIQLLGSSQTQTLSSPIKVYPVPTNDAGPLAITYASDQTFWFTEFSSGKIGEFFAQNDSFREFRVPTSGSIPAAITVDSIGQVWFSDQGGAGSVWMFNPVTKHFTQYPTLSQNSKPLFVLVDKKNNVWFAESTANRLGELVYPNYNMVEYPLPTANSEPVELAFGQNQSIIWITETYTGKIASFEVSTHAFKEYTPPASQSMINPVGIVVDQQGNVWVGEHGGSAVVELFPSNSTFRKYPTSLPPPSAQVPDSAVATLSIDSQGRLWFVEHFSNKVGRLNPATKTLEEFLIPTPSAYSIQNTLDADGNFWFTEFGGNVIGEILANASSPVKIIVSPSQLATNVSGGTVTTTVIVQNTLSVPISVGLNATSSLSNSGRVIAGGVTLNATMLNLAPGQSAPVKASITPSSSLLSGVYSFGVIASYENDSSVGIAFVSVQNSLSFVDIIESNFQIVIAVVLVVLLVAYLAVRKHGPVKKAN
jgi:virginiamycin B lyase